MHSFLVSVVLIVSAATLSAQTQPPRAVQIVRISTAAEQGIDQDSLDSVHVPATGPSHASCRFDSTTLPAFRAAWDAFLNTLMEQCVQQKITFDQLVVRCYVGSDGWADFIFFHAGDVPEVDSRFVAALRATAAAVRFPAAAGPYRQGATVQMGG